MAPPFPSRIALGALTSDNGSARNGAAVNSFEVAAGVLVADLSVTIVTGSVVCTSTMTGTSETDEATGRSFCAGAVGSGATVVPQPARTANISIQL